MFEESVNISTRDGVLPTFGVCPGGEGAYPAVMIYMDAPGIRDELRGFARRIAGEGYYCLLPDLYYRLGTLRFDFKNRDETMRKQIFDAWHSLTNATVMSDTEGVLSFFKENPRVREGSWGCAGYCMGGQFVVSAAGTYPEGMAAGASFYGVDVVTDKPDSPHLLAPRIKGELYMAFAEVDEWVPGNVIPDMKAAFDARGVSYRCDQYAGTHHGFCFPERPVYVREAAERAWAKMLDLFQRRLQRPGERSGP
ncbi:MAG: dienelactone hydrolase family protein [bacterium]|nr:dienelactone hydrolase family protein [bacterium]